MKNNYKQILWSMPVIGVRNLVEDIDGNVTEQMQYFEIDPYDFSDVCPECQLEALSLIHDLIQARAKVNEELTGDLRPADMPLLSRHASADLKVLRSSHDNLFKEGITGFVKTKDVYTVTS